MGMVAETAHVDYHTVYRLPTKENKLSFCIYRKQMEVAVFL
jgi:hypothetical protein